MENEHMTHTRSAAISLAFVLITGPALLFAESPVDDTTACIQALQLTPELAETGTYKVRVETCVRMRENLRLSQDRNLRNTLRAEKVQARLTRNSRVINYRSVGAVETPAQRQQRWNAIYGDESWLYSAPVARPSRRAIIDNAEATIRDRENTSAQEQQQRLIDAIEACKHYTNQFMRENCVRSEWAQ